MNEFNLRVTLNHALAPSYNAKVEITDDMIIIKDSGNVGNYPRNMFSLNHALESIVAHNAGMHVSLNDEDVAKIREALK